MNYRLFVFIIFISSFLSATATGPSYVSAEIHPISTNAKSEILCRTRFEKNVHGGHYYMQIEYGFCILNKNRITEIKTFTLDPSIIDKDGFTEEEYIEKQKYLDSVAISNLDFKKLTDQEKQICTQYEFRNNNVSKYKVDKIYKIPTFKTNWKVNLEKQKQIALKGANNTAYDYSDNIHVLYDFGNILILNNKYYEADENGTGTNFNYTHPMLGDMGYECFLITGILFLK